MTEPMERQIERFAPGLGDLVFGPACDGAPPRSSRGIPIRSEATRPEDEPTGCACCFGPDSASNPTRPDPAWSYVRLQLRREPGFTGCPTATALGVCGRTCSATAQGGRHSIGVGETFAGEGDSSLSAIEYHCVPASTHPVEGHERLRGTVPAQHQAGARLRCGKRESRILDRDSSQTLEEGCETCHHRCPI